MAQGEIDGFLRRKVPEGLETEEVLNEYSGDDPTDSTSELQFDRSSQITVESSGEGSNGAISDEESDMITDIDATTVVNEDNGSDFKKMEKVKVLDIFQVFGQQKKKEDEEAQNGGTSTSDGKGNSSTEISSENSSTQMLGEVNRNTKNDPKRKEVREEDEEDKDHIIIISSPVRKRSSVVSATDILTGNRKKSPPEIIERVEEDNDIGLIRDEELTSGCVWGKDSEKEYDDNEEDLVCINSDELEPPEMPKFKSGISAMNILTGKPGASKAQKPKNLKQPIEAKQRKRQKLSKDGAVSDASFGEDTIDLMEILSDEPSDKRVKKKSKRRIHKNEDDRSLIIRFKYTTRQQKISELEKKIKSALSEKTTNVRDFFDNSTNRNQSFEGDTLSSETQYGVPSEAKKHPTSLLYNQKITRKNPISKLNEVPLPELTGDQLHVKYKEEEFQLRSVSLPKRPEYIQQDLDLNKIPKLMSDSTQEMEPRYVFEPIQLDLSLYELAKIKIHKLSKRPYLERFLNILKTKEQLDNQPWTTLFKPKSAKDILSSPSLINEIELWIMNSFKILKKTTKRPNLKKGKRSKSEYDDFNDFIVNDDFDYDSENTEDEHYVPMIIIHGPHGVGKTSAVYTIVEENGGFVHEINTSMNRSRKDILGNLKELSTTQMMHVNQDNVDSNDFQNSVILFEDVDVLFESEDKGFWTVIESLVGISRRPIIMTCSDLSRVPKEILEIVQAEDTVYHMDRQDGKMLKIYLYLCGLVHNVIIDEDLLNSIILENNFDLKKLLNDLEFICKRDGTETVRLRLNKSKEKTQETVDNLINLNEVSSMVDLHSISDMIESRQVTLLNQDPISEDMENDADVLWFEFNYPKEVRNYLPRYPPHHSQETQSRDDLRQKDMSYFRTKLKPSKRITRAALTSSALLEFGNDTYDNEVFHELPFNKYITEVSPVIRDFARFDLLTQKNNNEVLERFHGTKSLNELIHEGLASKLRFSGDGRELLANGSLMFWKEM